MPETHRHGTFAPLAIMLGVAALAGCSDLRFGGQVIQTDAFGSDGGAVLVTIQDPRELIESFADARPEELLRRVRTIDVERVPGDASSLDVAWVLRDCNRAPTLHLARTTVGLDIALDPGPAGGDGCAGLPITYRLRLTLDTSIDGWAIQSYLLRDGVSIPQ